MRQKKYKIAFTDGHDGETWVEVYAFTEQEAQILAQAERIKAGLDFSVLKVIFYSDYYKNWYINEDLINLDEIVFYNKYKDS